MPPARWSSMSHCHTAPTKLYLGGRPRCEFRTTRSRAEMTTKLDAVTIQILWNRLIAIVDEAATGLIRTAYTPSVKEYHDFCCALFDTSGQMLAHSTVTTAGFLGIVPEVMRNFLRKYPPQTAVDGDAIITND